MSIARRVKEKTIYLLLVPAMLITSNTAIAQKSGDAGTIFKNPIKYSSFTELLVSMLKGVTIILMPIMALMIVWIGFRMVLEGREKSAEYAKHKQSFIYALVGLFLVLGANGILSVIQNTVGEVIAS